MRLDDANARLLTIKAGVRIQRRGDRLYLRATLPPKPGSSKDRAHQQEISLGVYCNPDGVQRAYSEAQRLSSDIALGRFAWGDWCHSVRTEDLTIGDWIRRFEADYWRRRKRTPQSLTTWEVNYQCVFCRLPLERSLSLLTLLPIIDRTMPDSRSRLNFVTSLQALCNFAGAGIDLSPYRGNYSPKRVKPRDIPSDDVILEYFDKIANPGWRWVYGMMAAYGLRNHEVFHCDLELLRSGEPFLRVLEGKTGERRSLPLHKEWFEKFELHNPILPNCSGSNNRALGSRVTNALQRLGVPFSPYNLRHAWALRAAVLGMPTKIASELQGHSEAVHAETYQAFLRDDQVLDVWRKL